MNSTPRQYSLVKYVFDYKEHPFEKNKPYVFLGEIPQMPGHCIVADYKTGQLYCGYHTENFEEIPEDEC